jgi:hypothetical protein
MLASVVVDLQVKRVIFEGVSAAVLGPLLVRAGTVAPSRLPFVARRRDGAARS